MTGRKGKDTRKGTPPRRARPAATPKSPGRGRRSAKEPVRDNASRRAPVANVKPPKKRPLLHSPSAKPASSRKVPQQARRDAILKAALSVFAEHGFEAARLDDVASRAGVAKGTLYLYFEHKEALFEALVRMAVAPILARLAALASSEPTSPLRTIEQIYALFAKEVLGTDRKLLLRLIISEAPRFPAMAGFYHREVVSRGLPILRALASRAAAERDIPSDAAARFPQLIIAPLLVSVVWDALFSSIEPLDAAGLFSAHLDILTGGRKPA